MARASLIGAAGIATPGNDPMADLAKMQAQLNALKSARSSGAREIQFGERRVVYRTDGELRAAIAALQAEVDNLQGAARVRNVVVRTLPHKGW